MMIRRFSITAAFVLAGILTGQSQDYITLDSLDRYFAHTVSDWGMPGMAIGIIQDDSLVFAKGYGVREHGKKGRISPSTNFAIASLSKAFTSGALAVLVDEGKLGWDDKVTDHLPWFRLYDPYVTANITVRDLLCHRAGYGTFSGDMLWFETTYSRDEILERTRFLEPKFGFREEYGYSNLMYIAAGQVIEAVSGKTWDDFVTEHFLDPLEMKRTVTSIRYLDELGDYAMPHAVNPGEVIPVPYMGWDNVAAAGGLNSNVEDLSHWVKMLLGNGVLGGDTFFTPQRIAEMWTVETPQAISPGSKRLWPSTHFKGYGLGWGLNDYKGHEIVSHSGGTDGMTTYLCLVPEKDLGFIILTNAYSYMFYPMRYMILDAYLGSDGTDWGATFLGFHQQGLEAERKNKEEDIAARIPDTSPSLPLDAYCGTYGGDMYGNAEIRKEGDALVIDFLPAPGLVAELSHWHYDTFKLTFRELESLPEGKVNFDLDQDGNVVEMHVDVPNPDFFFTELEFKRIER